MTSVDDFITGLRSESNTKSLFKLNYDGETTTAYSLVAQLSQLGLPDGDVYVRLSPNAAEEISDDSSAYLRPVAIYADTQGDLVIAVAGSPDYEQGEDEDDDD